MTCDTQARRLALALLRLREAGDRQGMALLAASLDAEQARAALLAQTENASVLFEALFGTVVESWLPLIAEQFGRSRDDVVDHHPERLILRMALAEGE
ncbi:hypothetical protein AB0D67_17220 [Streptosporangium sp. NPDC048047]|uniref:hypothetical protein n=1 Tax=Streptosporangium sp. NPDC048047 TaxID=3155748 RepID=UPI003419204B